MHQLKGLLVSLFVLATSQTFSQVKGSVTPMVSGSSGSDPSSAMAALRSDIIPHSPEAEALAKYTDLPVTLYSGTPNISVPIYEIKTPSLDIPFYLGYNYNGYKPNEQASWVGLGWSIQGTGVITRIVKGRVDESMVAGSRYSDYVRPTLMAWSQPFLYDVANNNVDTEPDIYSFNVGGYSGKFILIKGKAYTFPYQNIQIVPVGAGFKITDDKGNTYLFNDYETTYTKSSPGNLVPVHSSTWYVSRIVSADLKDTISYSYSP